VSFSPTAARVSSNKYPTPTTFKLSQCFFFVTFLQLNPKDSLLFDSIITLLKEIHKKNTWSTKHWKERNTHPKTLIFSTCFISVKLLALAGISWKLEPLACPSKVLCMSELMSLSNMSHSNSSWIGWSCTKNFIKYIMVVLQPWQWQK